MGVLDSFKKMVRGGDKEAPVQEIDEIIENAEIRNQLEDTPHVEAHISPEPVMAEIPEPEPELFVPEGTTYSERSAKGKLKRGDSIKAPISDLLSKSEEESTEAIWIPKPKPVNTSPEAVWVSKTKEQIITPTVKEQIIATPAPVEAIEEPYERALKAGKITEDEAVNYLKQEQGLNEEQAKQKIKSIVTSVKTTGDEFVPPPDGRGLFGSLGDTLINKAKNIKLKSTSELVGNATANIKGQPVTITGTDADLEYAIAGGYSGLSRTSLETDILSSEKSIDELKEQLKRIEEQIDAKNVQKDKKSTLRDKTSDLNERKQYTEELTQINGDIKLLDAQRARVLEAIAKKEELIQKRKEKIDEYNRAVIAGKKVSSKKSLIKQKLRDLSEGSLGIQSGVYSAGISTKKDWFGKQGFLSQPFKQENITRSAVEPVKVSTRNLDYVTRSTGGSVGRNIIDVTQVKPNRNVAPLGAPGTIYGARQQFDYNIPAKRISLLEVSGRSKGGNINPDILPSLYDTPKPMQMAQPVQQQYKQVIQEDGSIINVPVPTQGRKSKIFAVSVNRYSHRVQYPSKSNKQIGTGIKAVGVGNMLKGLDKFKPLSNGSMASIKPYKGSQSIGNIKLTSNLDIGINSLKERRSISPITIGERPDVHLGLISPDQSGVVYKERAPKKSNPLVKLGTDITGIKFNKNLKKYVLKNKTK